MKMLSVIVATVLLAACTSSDNPRRAPAYATPIDSSGFRVMCRDLGVREVYVRFDALDTFFHPDGTEKTRDEFCSESNAGARSR